MTRATDPLATTPQPSGVQVRRSCLVVPGSSPRMLVKACGLPADQVIIDLEDAVAPEAKAAARRAAVDVLTTGEWRATTGRAFRCNALGTPWARDDLLEVVGGAAPVLEAVVVPKVSDPDEVREVDELLARLERDRGLPVGTVGLQLQLETVEGLLRLDAISTASRRVRALTYGPGDLATALGMPPSTIGGESPAYPGDHWHHVRFTLLLHARRVGALAIDGPFADVRDEPGLRRVAASARALGMDGKWVIHPGQLATVNEVFGIDQVTFERASDLLDAHAAAATDARGAALFGAEMIDEASRRQAERTVEGGRMQGRTVRPTPPEVPPHERAAWRAAHAAG